MTTNAGSLPTTALPRSGALALVARGAMAFALTLLALLSFFVAFAAGYAIYHADRVVPGVSVAGVALGGLDRAAAEATLREHLPALNAGTLTIRIDGKDHQVAYADIGRDYDIARTLESALGVAQGDSILTTFQHQLLILAHGVNVEPSITWNNDQLSRRLEALVAANSEPAHDATIVRQDGRYVVQPATEGATIDLKALLERAMVAVGGTSASNSAIEVVPTPVAPAVSTEQARQAAARAEAVTGGPLELAAADSRTTIDSNTLRGWVRVDQAQAGWPLVIERAPIVQFLTEFAQTADHPATDAAFKWSGEGIKVVAAQAGQAIDVQAAADRIVGALNQRANGGNPGVVSLPTTATSAEFSTQQAQAIADQVENVGEWTTHFTPSRFNGRGVNIRIPTEIIDGTVIMPGERFDFWDVVGELSTDKGYVMGAAIIRGHLDPDGALGGGMCSVSTTIFNAALRGGLQIDARRNHALYYTRYPLGLDATVWITKNSRLTTAFTNDTDYPVFIRGIAKQKTITFQIWTVPTGRRVVLSEPVKTNVKTPAYKAIQYTNSLPEGKRQLVDAEHIGMNVSVTRTVYDADGNVIHQDTFTSRYKMTPQLYLVGRAPDDPPDGTGKKIYDKGEASKNWWRWGRVELPVQSLQPEATTSVSDALLSIGRAAIGSVPTDPSTFPCGLCYRLRDLTGSASPLNDASTARGDEAASTLTLWP
jgi:vancomycin resistance protein YoaR